MPTACLVLKRWQAVGVYRYYFSPVLGSVSEIKGRDVFSPLKRTVFSAAMNERITWADFEKIQIVTGTILTAEPFPQARKPAYKLTIDFGPEGIKQTSAQLTNLYQPADLVSMQVVAVINFPPKQIATFMSECLVLGSVAADGTVTLLTTERPAENGLRIG